MKQVYRNTCRQDSKKELQAFFVLERLPCYDVAENVNTAVGDEGSPTLFVADDGGQALVRVRHDQQVLFVQLVVRVVDDVQQNG